MQVVQFEAEGVVQAVGHREEQKVTVPTVLTVNKVAVMIRIPMILGIIKILLSSDNNTVNNEINKHKNRKMIKWFISY